MPRKPINQQRDLFETVTNDPLIVLPPDQKKQLLALIQTMLIEITSVSVSEEIGDDEDHA